MNNREERALAKLTMVGGVAMTPFKIQCFRPSPISLIASTSARDVTLSNSSDRFEHEWYLSARILCYSLGGCVDHQRGLTTNAFR